MAVAAMTAVLFDVPGPRARRRHRHRDRCRRRGLGRLGADGSCGSCGTRSSSPRSKWEPFLEPRHRRASLRGPPRHAHAPPAVAIALALAFGALLAVGSAVRPRLAPLAEHRRHRVLPRRAAAAADPLPLPRASADRSGPSGRWCSVSCSTTDPCWPRSSAPASCRCRADRARPAYAIGMRKSPGDAADPRSRRRCGRCCPRSSASASSR